MLPTDLAGRIQEFLKRTTGNSCADAASLNIKRSRFGRRAQEAASYYEELLCRVEDVVVNARDKGPLAELGEAANRQVQLLWRDPMVQLVQMIAQNRARNNMQTLHFTSDDLWLAALVSISVFTVVAFLQVVVDEASLAVHNFISQAKLFLTNHAQAETCTTTVMVGTHAPFCP